MHRLRNMACVRGIGPYQLGLRRDRGVRLVAPTAQRLRRDPQILGDLFNSLTAFALNSGVYLVPFVMVPSSPIELGGNAEQKSVHITQAEGETKEGRQQEADALSTFQHSQRKLSTIQSP